jgi:hypothetical protein
LPPPNNPHLLLRPLAQARGNVEPFLILDDLPALIQAEAGDGDQASHGYRTLVGGTSLIRDLANVSSALGE